MTLKEAIDYTIKKHPNWSCYTILGSYFLLNERAIELSKGKGCLVSAFSREDARNYINSIGKGKVIEEMRKDLKLPSSWTGNISALVNMYCNYYENLLKQSKSEMNNNMYIDNFGSSVQKVSREINQNNNTSANGFETLRQSFSNMLKRYSYEDVRSNLEQNYKNNKQIANYVEQVAQYMRMNYAQLYSKNALDLYLMFADDSYNYYNIYMEEQSSDLINQCKRNTDTIMDLNNNPNYKAQALYDLYNGDGNLLPYLPSNIDAKDVKVSIISNAVRASLINLDFETQHRIKDLYKGKSNDEIEADSLRLQRIVGFILNQDYKNLGIYKFNIYPEDVFEQINKLNASDIKFLCDLYVINNNENLQGKELLRHADSVTSYFLPSDKNAGLLSHYNKSDINYLKNSNENKYYNLSSLLSIIESSDFVRKLDEDNYHM